MEGVDYHATCARTTSAAFISPWVIIVSLFHWGLRHFDEEQVLVQSHVKAEMHIRLPIGCALKSAKVVLLIEFIDGLEQVSKSSVQHQHRKRLTFRKVWRIRSSCGSQSEGRTL